MENQVEFIFLELLNWRLLMYYVSKFLRIFNASHRVRTCQLEEPPHVLMSDFPQSLSLMLKKIKKRLV